MQIKLAKVVVLAASAGISIFSLPHNATAQVALSTACNFFTASVGGCVPPAPTGTWLSATGWASLPTSTGLPSTPPNQVLAGPPSGTNAATAAPRPLVAADLPSTPIVRHTGAYTLQATDLGSISILHGSTAATTWTLPAVGSTGFAINGLAFAIANDDPNILTLSSTSSIVGPVTLCQYGWDVLIVDVANKDWQVFRSVGGSCP